MKMKSSSSTSEGMNLKTTLENFSNWLETFGETSYDHQSFFAGPVGSRIKALYYQNKVLGLPAVAPIIFLEAFAPSARTLFHQRTRFPIADAHYAMGFASFYGATGEKAYLNKAIHFLEILKTTRCQGYDEYCWGYPFDWVTRSGVLSEHTPMITSNPYLFEAFQEVNEHDPREEWVEIMQSIVRHACTDIKDFKISEKASTCSYTPFDKGGVINAAAYRAGMLTKASKFFNEDKYWKIAERNLYFVLENQQADGSWFYASDAVRDFVDHFHTCFVMKALAKIHSITGHEECLAALKRGVSYYLEHLFDEKGLPKPFSKAPRLTVYKRELYDCAECINLCLLLRDRFPELQNTLETVTSHILEKWIQPSGAFRARKLLVGWDNVPMHRWGQSQMFCALAKLLAECLRPESGGLRT